MTRRGVEYDHPHYRLGDSGEIERGLEQSESETISHEEIKAKLLKLQHA